MAVCSIDTLLGNVHDNVQPVNWLYIYLVIHVKLYIIIIPFITITCYKNHSVGDLSYSL